MEKVTDIASYIYQRYQKQFGKCIDEMKLHKLLYFTQRESIIQTDEPIFQEEFEAWKYGPVMTGIRRMYKDGSLTKAIPQSIADRYKYSLIHQFFIKRFLMWYSTLMPVRIPGV